MKFYIKIIAIFLVSSTYSPTEENDSFCEEENKNFEEFFEELKSINKNLELEISELNKKIERLNQNRTDLQSQLYVAENRFNDRNKDHERIVKDKDSEITKLKKKSWGAKAAPYLACTLSCVLIFVVMRIYFTLYPLKDDPIVI